MNSKHRPKFAKWVPAAARARIIDKLAEPDLAPHMCALCFRLEEFPAMRAVWDSLRGIGHEDFIIDAVVLRYEWAISLRPPVPKKLTDLEKYVRQYTPVPSAEGIALKARWMLDEMRERQADAQFFWESLWPGERGMTFDKLAAVIEHTEVFYRNIAEERQKAIAALALPPLPRKLGAKRAKETYFSRLLSVYFAKIIGRPADTVVEILTDVAFDLSGELAPGIAKGRRRSAGKHYREKTK